MDFQLCSVTRSSNPNLANRQPTDHLLIDIDQEAIRRLPDQEVSGWLACFTGIDWQGWCCCSMLRNRVVHKAWSVI